MSDNTDPSIYKRWKELETVDSQLKKWRNTTEELTWLQGRTQTTLVQTRPGGVGRE